MEGCDAVFLTGAYYPKDSLDLESALARGVGGVRNACEAARAVGGRALRVHVHHRHARPRARGGVSQTPATCPPRCPATACTAP
jgi:hypothetical protein